MPSVPSPEYLERCLAHHPDSPIYWVAYSGGLDSTVLLHLCATLGQRLAQRRFRALHVHHGLHPEADTWVEHCERQCQTLGVELHTRHVDGRSVHGKSPEESARAARYRALREVLGPGDTVLLAQHLDDQAETLLLQLFRGAGLAGLAAMPDRSELPPGFLLRPLLDVPRTVLRDYAERHGLSWVEDPSNREVAYDRNYLRNNIFPQLKAHWPGLNRVLARSARHCAEALKLLDDRAEVLLASVGSTNGNTLSLGRLRGLAPEDRRLVLRAWIKNGGFRMPSATVLECILEQNLASGPDRNPMIRWSEGEVRRYRDVLHLLPRLPSFEAGEPVHWPPGEDRMELARGNGVLVLRSVPAGGIPLSRWRTARILIGYRQGGETLRLRGRQGAHELRKLFQEAGIPPWIRERMPLIYLDDELVSVAGYWLAEETVPGGETSPGLIPEWLQPPGLGFELAPSQGLPCLPLIKANL